MVLKKSSTGTKKSSRKKTANRETTAKKASSKKSSGAKHKQFPVVGVGGSAGGLEAFSALLRGMPAESGMAFVYIQHVDPSHESLLGDLLGRATRMPVTTVTKTMKLEPNHIYVIAPNTEITIADHQLRMHRRKSATPFHPIDRFFESLAERRKNGAIGVILSGTATDGVRGIREIKARGGFNFAQEPKTAKFDSMPRHAIATECVDRVLPPAEIAKELNAIGRHPYVDGAMTEQDDARFVHEDGMKELFGLLCRSGDIDFREYKPGTVRRRIARRMALLRTKTLEEYLQKLRSDPEERNALQEDMLIRVTSFFREPEVTEALRDKVFPKLLQSKRDKPLRLWVPGCATGQEVYSLAIALIESLSGRNSDQQMQIFGIDVSNSAIEFARAGVYSESIAGEVSKERLRRFFTKVESGFRVSNTVRERCLFARHDVIRDPPFSKIDVISCRNLLIYLEVSRQKRLAATFHYALNSNGYLVLGKSESLGVQTLFVAEDSKNKIFRPKPVATPRVFDFASPDPPEIPSPEATAGKRRIDAQIHADAESFIWEHYSAAGMIVDTDLQVHHVRGDTSAYVSMASGEASLHLPRLLRPELALKARSLIQKVKKTNKPAQQENLRVKKNGGFRTVHLKVVPRGRRDGLQTFLVFFEDVRQAPQGKKKAASESHPVAQEVSELQKELASTQQYLQSVIEDQESSNEELRAANEEVRSANEELQSTNEELETAKEELQSSNEELTTLNEELRDRNSDLRSVNDELENLLLGISAPVVIIGGDHRIRRFTPAAEKLLNLLPGDVGRPIENVKGDVEMPDLKEMIDRVVERIEFVEREVKDDRGHWYAAQLRPFKTAENKIDGVLMCLVNIDRERAAEQGREKSEGALQVSRQWSTGLLSLQEDERRRLARELHDDVNQQLAAVIMQVEALKEAQDGSQRHQIQKVHGRLQGLLEQIRALSHQLHPATLELLGLATALKALCEELNETSGIAVRCEQSRVPKEIPAEMALNLFRVAQEAIKNATQHSEASVIRVTLVGLKKQLRLTVEDNGKGFDPAKDIPRRGLGLLSIKERLRALSGKLSVNSKPGGGTTIEAKVPL